MVTMSMRELDRFKVIQTVVERRLVRDYERRPDVSEAMVFIAMCGLLLRRIAHP